MNNRVELSTGKSKSNPEPPIQYGHYSSIVEKVRRSVVSGTVNVLFTDVDATLVLGAGHSAGEIAKSLEDMRQLTANLNAREFIIIPVTGSHLEVSTDTTSSILQRVLDGTLPGLGPATDGNSSYQVDAYVCDGGAVAVQAIHAETAIRDPHYASFVVPQCLDPQAISVVALREVALVNERPLSEEEARLLRLYDPSPSPDRMFLQPGSVTGQHQESNKLAFYFYASDLAERDFIEARFKKAVEGFGLEVICCEEKDVTSAARRHPHVLPMIEEGAAPLKYCLDIVPFTKGSAVKYFAGYISQQVAEVALELNVRRPEIKIWACGDSGNDLPLMSAPEVNAVVLVGGSSPELLRASAGLLAAGKDVIVESDVSRAGPSSISAAIDP